eukprot:TRINITY_DN74056_c0_g1_i1.p1 TRINITY_DN74056_c0_g1~~TRINITY_DN74056_c0_g1_i1.p1  ORF type:complete len:297 (-),score=48.47 TRINITY_DN74056_c0_g1_i1:347-1180(-)
MEVVRTCAMPLARSISAADLATLLALTSSASALDNAHLWRACIESELQSAHIDSELLEPKHRKAFLRVYALLLDNKYMPFLPKYCLDLQRLSRERGSRVTWVEYRRTCLKGTMTGDRRRQPAFSMTLFGRLANGIDEGVATEEFPLAPSLAARLGLPGGLLSLRMELHNHEINVSLGYVRDSIAQHAGPLSDVDISAIEFDAHVVSADAELDCTGFTFELDRGAQEDTCGHGSSCPREASYSAFLDFGLSTSKHSVDSCLMVACMLSPSSGFITDFE